MKPVRIVYVLLSALSLAACGRTVDSFFLELPDSGVTRLSQDRSVDPELEGRLIDELGATPLYTLQTPRQTSGETWYFRFGNLDREITIATYGPDETVIAARTVRPPEGAPPKHEIGLRMPASTVAAFRILGEVTQPDGPGPVLEALFVVSSQDALATLTPEGTLRVAPNAEVSAWASQQEGVGRWDIDLPGTATPVEIEYRFNVPLDLARPPQPVTVDWGDLRYEMTVRPGMNRVVLYSRPHRDESALRILSGVPGFDIASISRAADPVGGPDNRALLADPGTILEYPESAWRDRDFEIFRWNLYPEVLVIDTRNYDVQARFFKRLAFFTEKEGFRGQILDNSQLAGRHGYNAHNYNAAGLASFFTRVEELGLRLNPEEIRLRDILLDEGMIVVGDGGYEHGEGGVLSISRESLAIPGLRELLLTHEALHGVYYADEVYREQVDQLWSSLGEDERRFWELLLDGLQYDVTDPYLVRNEFHAYLLQQEIGRVTWYFEVRSAERLKRWKPQEAGWIDAFISRNRGLFRDRAEEANRILFRASGLEGGSVTDLRRL